MSSLPYHSIVGLILLSVDKGQTTLFYTEAKHVYVEKCITT